MKMSNIIELYMPNSMFSLFQNFTLKWLTNFTKSAGLDTKSGNLTTKSKNIQHYLFLACNQVYIALYLHGLSKRKNPKQSSFKV
jgi:hypothetical protein